MSAAQVRDLEQQLEGIRCVERNDGWLWDMDNIGEFTVATTRRWIDHRVLPIGPKQTRWCKVVPSKVNIFVWRLLWNKLPTRVLLCGKGIQLPSWLCPMCGMEEETISHVFIASQLASILWRLVFRWMQFPMILTEEPQSVFDWIDAARMSKEKRKVVEMIVCTTFWLVWRCRNDEVHETRLIRKDGLFDSIRQFSFLWFCVTTETKCPFQSSQITRRLLRIPQANEVLTTTLKNPSSMLSSLTDRSYSSASSERHSLPRRWYWSRDRKLRQTGSIPHSFKSKILLKPDPLYYVALFSTFLGLSCIVSKIEKPRTTLGNGKYNFRMGYDIYERIFDLLFQPRVRKMNFIVAGNQVAPKATKKNKMIQRYT
ncbi:hypothetical protein LXL04_006041 [Taraxacum kok-saghyz]